MRLNRIATLSVVLLLVLGVSQPVRAGGEFGGGVARLAIPAKAGVQCGRAARNSVKAGSRIARRIAGMGISITAAAACPG